MQNLTIDTGMQEYLINNRAVLRFNPSDPNLYHRFFAAAPKLDALDAELTKQLVSKLWTLLQGKTTTGITDYFGVEL